MRTVFRDPGRELAFNSDGYVIVPMLSKSEVDKLRKLYSSHTSDTFDEGFHTSFLSKDVEFKTIISDTFKELFKDKLEDLLIDYRVLFTHYLIKEPNTSFKFNLHVDATTVDETRHQSLTIWCALEDTDATNGGLFVWKAGHKSVHGFRSVSQHNPVDESVGEQVDKVNIVLKKGEALIMNQKLPHGSMPNPSKNRRIAAGIHLVPQEAKSIMCFKESEETLSIYEILNYNFYIDGFEGDNSKNSKHLQFKYNERTSWTGLSAEDNTKVESNGSAENV